MFKKIVSLILSISLILIQPVFAQGVAELNIGKYLNQMPVVKTDSFRPARLRYVSYDVKANSFQLLLDKGDGFNQKTEEPKNGKTLESLNSSTPKLQESTQELFNYFLIGLSLPNDKFWVNLRPDAPEQIIDPLLEKTDMGKIMLEADLQLKKDTSSLTSPQNPEGKQYWDKLYKKAGELFGTENITIPTITRPWIVPGEVIIRESEDSAYIYKANLKVMLEEDYLNNQKTEKPKNQKTDDYNFSDPRLKELNKYSTELIKELILPRLTQEINTSKKYAQLRQVFFSLILSRWFKDKYGPQSPVSGLQSSGQNSEYVKRIDSGNLTDLVSKDPWSKDYYFNEYKKSFQQGEYNLKEQVSTPTGQVIRSYVSGGANLTGSPKPLIDGSFKSIRTSSPINWQTASLIGISIALTGGAISVFYKFIKNGVMPTTDYIRKFKIIEGGISAALDYADKYMLSADDAILLHKRFRNYQDMGPEEIIEIIEGTIKLLEQPYPKPRNKINQENRERVITILGESLKAAGSSPLEQKEAEERFFSMLDTYEKAINSFIQYIENNITKSAKQILLRVVTPYLELSKETKARYPGPGKTFADLGLVLIDMLNGLDSHIESITQESEAAEQRNVDKMILSGFKECLKAMHTLRQEAEALEKVISDSMFFPANNSFAKTQIAPAQSQSEMVQIRAIAGLTQMYQRVEMRDKRLLKYINQLSRREELKAYRGYKDINLIFEAKNSPTGLENLLALEIDDLRGNQKLASDSIFVAVWKEYCRSLIAQAIQILNDYDGDINQIALDILKILQRYIVDGDYSIPMDRRIAINKALEDKDGMGYFKEYRSPKTGDLTEEEELLALACEEYLNREKEGVSSSLMQNEMTNEVGGIDLRKIEYLARPMGSFQGLDLRLPLLSKAELEGIDINKELASVEQMVNARIDVSTDRLKRLLAAMSQKDAFTSQRETQLLPLLLRLCWLKEEKGTETTSDFRSVLLIADTGLFVEQGNTRYTLN